MIVSHDKSFGPSFVEAPSNIHACCEVSEDNQQKIKELCLGIYLTEAQTHRLAHSFFFLYYGVVMGSWISMFPTIIDELGITSADFGGFLSIAGIGSLGGLLILYPYLSRHGSKRSLLVGSALLSSFLAFGGMKGANTWTVLISFIGVGASSTIMDCSNNSLAHTLETSLHDHFFGSLQACGSIGNLVGALSAGWAFSLGVTIVNYSFFVGFVGMAISSIFFIHDVYDDKKHKKNVNFIVSADGATTIRHPSVERLNDKADNEDEDNQFSSLNKSVISCKLKNYPSYPISVGPDTEKHTDAALWMKFYGMCGIGFFNNVSVGSVGNWSTTYFSDILGTSPAFTSVGYAGYMSCYVFGQLFSDQMVKHFGVQKLLIGSASIACTGLILVVFAPSNPFLFGETCSTSATCPIIATAGYCLAGIGLSQIAPTVLSESTNFKLPSMNSKDIISRYLLIAGSGFSIGPLLFSILTALLGSLRWALLAAPFLMFLVIPISFYVIGGNEHNPDEFAYPQKPSSNQSSDDQLLAQYRSL